MTLCSAPRTTHTWWVGCHPHPRLSHANTCLNMHDHKTPFKERTYMYARHNMFDASRLAAALLPVSRLAACMPCPAVVIFFAVAAPKYRSRLRTAPGMPTSPQTSSTGSSAKASSSGRQLNRRGPVQASARACACVMLQDTHRCNITCKAHATAHACMQAYRHAELSRPTFRPSTYLQAVVRAYEQFVLGDVQLPRQEHLAVRPGAHVLARLVTAACTHKS